MEGREAAAADAGQRAAAATAAAGAAGGKEGGVGLGLGAAAAVAGEAPTAWRSREIAAEGPKEEEGERVGGTVGWGCAGG